MLALTDDFAQPAPIPLKGHIPAATVIGDMCFWGRGVAIDNPRAMAAYKIAAEAGDALSQHQVGAMYYRGRGVAVDYKQARPWLDTLLSHINRGPKFSHEIPLNRSFHGQTQLF